MEKKQAEFIEKLLAQMTEMSMEAKIVDGTGRWQIGNTLMVLIPVGENGERALLEIATARFDEDLFFINLYSTVIAETKNTDVSLHKLNLTCPVGAFGIAENQVYHRYTLLFDEDSDVDIMMYETVRALAGISYIIAVNLTELAKMFL